MRSSLLWAVPALSLLAPAARAGPGVPQTQTVPFARLRLVEPTAELRSRGLHWRRALEGAPVSIGEALRVPQSGVARLELPWMALTLTSGALVRLSDEFLLSVVLEGGRVVIESESRETLKLLTAEAEIRGRGRAVVRRTERATLVSCLAGRFRVGSAAGSTALERGQGTVVLPGRGPGVAREIPAAPQELWPADDPVYVAAGDPAELRWRAGEPAYVVELLPVGSDAVLFEREVELPRLRIAIPWPGAFRWRVSARDAQGLEGTPSSDGLIAVE